MLTSQHGQNVFKRVLTIRIITKEGWFGAKFSSGVADVFCYAMVVGCILWMLMLGGVSQLIMYLL